MSNILTKNDVIKGSSSVRWEGKILVLKDSIIQEQYRERKYQLWYALSGFGCDPTKIGRAVFCTCLSDGDNARFDRSDFLGVFNGELTEQEKATLDKLTKKDGVTNE